MAISPALSLKPLNSVSLWYPSSSCPSAVAQVECLGVSLCAGHLEELLDFPQTSVSPKQMDKIPAYFHIQVLWVLFFPALVLQSGEPGVAL